MQVHSSNKTNQIRIINHIFLTVQVHIRVQAQCLNRSKCLCIFLKKNHRPCGTHKSSQPRPCLGPQAVPTSVATPPRTVQSTCRWQNKLEWVSADSTTSCSFNINAIDDQVKPEIHITHKSLLKQTYTEDPTWRHGSYQAQPACKTRQATRGRRRWAVTDQRRRASWAPVWCAPLPAGPVETEPPAPSSAAAAPSPPAAAAPASQTFSPPSEPESTQPEVLLWFTWLLINLLQWQFEVFTNQLIILF